MALNSNAIKAQQAFETIMGKASVLRGNLQSQRVTLSANGASADVVLNAMRGVKVTRDLMAANVTAPGLQAYARFIYDDPAKDFIAAVNSATTACDALLSWVVANFPKDAEGYLLKDKITNGEIVARTFTAAAMAGLVAQIDTLIAAL